MAFLKLFCFALTILAYFFFVSSYATRVTLDYRAIKINSDRKLLFSGSIHYPRSTPEMWPDLIAKAKEGGLDAIETYVFWNAHEPVRREYNFNGNLNLIGFLKEIKNAGLYAILRIGPYVCAEWNYGGLPAWLLKTPGMKFRTNNQPFKDEMKTFVTLIANMIKSEGLLASQGGPIILAQIENEYGDIESGIGDGAKEYIGWCSQLAQSLNVRVPWVMCKEPDAPQPMIDTCNGFYCDQWAPNNPTVPKMWTENWTGWFKAWDTAEQHRPAEDLAFSVARFIQLNGTLVNYYMYHGGTNFGRTSGGPYITTSYDYDAPLDEFGNANQPKWGHMKELHATMKMMEDAIVNGAIKHTDFLNETAVTEFSHYGSSSCFLSNGNLNDTTIYYMNTPYVVPAWSVSILANCTEEVFNTAKVGTQTSINIKKPNGAQQQPSLVWKWRPENLTDHLQGMNPSFTQPTLLEQVSTTADVSDYLWYITSVDHLKKGNMTLRVNTTGHGLYAFVNGVLVGSQYASSSSGPFNFIFECPVSVNDGLNVIALLSTTVSLQNYGAYYEQKPAGIVGGPVQLIGGNVTTDLSNNMWSYKIGLNGLTRQMDLGSDSQNITWNSDKIPTQTPFTWYQATLQVPSSSDPVVLDLQGMQKGVAWVNNKNIGRFWLKFNVAEDDCTPCDYRGNYNKDRCKTGCGGPAQRWYHVPRAYLNPGDNNTVTLFEEAGGDPSLVSLQSVVVATICGSVFEGKTLNLSCPSSNSTVTKIDFASFGNPQGACQSFQKGSCDAPGVVDKIQTECVGKQTCSISADQAVLGACAPAPAGDFFRKLAVQAVCS